MTPDQVLALLQLLATLQMTIAELNRQNGQLQQDNAQMREQLTATNGQAEGVTASKRG